MSLQTQHLASKLQANWLAKETSSCSDQSDQPSTKLDDLTSLSWLHNVSILPVNNNNTVKEGVPVSTDPQPVRPVATPHTSQADTGSSVTPSHGQDTCAGPESHLQELLSKKFQIQQKTSVKKLCHHFKLLSEVNRVIVRQDTDTYMVSPKRAI